MNVSERPDPLPENRSETGAEAETEAGAETAPESRSEPRPDTVGQLRLLPSPPGSPREWVLDERTRRIGRAGVARARAVLQQAHPPTPRESGVRRAS